MLQELNFQELNNVVVEILKVGFLGFAFLSLYLSLRLVSTLVRTTGMPLDNLKQKIHAVYGYMAFSVFAIVCALAFFILDQQKTIDLTIDKLPGRHQQVKAVPLKTQEAQIVHFENSDSVVLRVKNHDRITIYTDDLDEFIEELEEVKEELDAKIEAQAVRIQGLENNQQVITDAVVDRPTVSPDDEGGI